MKRKKYLLEQNLARNIFTHEERDSQKNVIAGKFTLTQVLNY